MGDLKESSDVLLIMFSGNLFQSVIVLGKKDSCLYSILQDGIWKLLVWECRVCFLGFQLYRLLFCRTYSNVNLFYGLGGCAILDVVTYYQR
jgi:hypothetical protein